MLAYEVMTETDPERRAELAALAGIESPEDNQVKHMEDTMTDQMTAALGEQLSDEERKALEKWSGENFVPKSERWEGTFSDGGHGGAPDSAVLATAMNAQTIEAWSESALDLIAFRIREAENWTDGDYRAFVQDEHATQWRWVTSGDFSTHLDFAAFDYACENCRSMYRIGTALKRRYLKAVDELERLVRASTETEIDQNQIDRAERRIEGYTLRLDFARERYRIALRVYEKVVDILAWDQLPRKWLPPEQLKKQKGHSEVRKGATADAALVAGLRKRG